MDLSVNTKVSVEHITFVFRGEDKASALITLKSVTGGKSLSIFDLKSIKNVIYYDLMAFR